MRSLLLIVALTIPSMTTAAADSAAPPFSHGTQFDEQTGETLYRAVCQGCHMPDATGAMGAGRYPSLASNQKLVVAEQPISMLLHGLNGMPPVGQMMSDAQVAKVVNYVRTHFGNAYTDIVTAEDVAALR